MGLGIRKMLVALKTNLIKLQFKNLHLEKGAVLEGTLEVMKNGRVTIGKNTHVRRWCCFRPYGGYIKIGDNCTVNSFSHISGNGGVEIGNNVLIATQCVIVSANHIFEDCKVPISVQGETKEKITIEDDCWLGAGVKVIAGVTIHKGSVIGAGTVVTHDVPPYSVVVGVPGKVIKNRMGE
ncbi:MAG TPA: acyltransferase [Lachnoclostridium sp.]|nr:acyltransferase [Lachnoclostridium sp.]